ncbi:MAG TPA: hypothetical protein VNJ01_16130 [Bacteriovoracaceae bacterium]|nr:hypothetical protein [Bacteriovoracaceae bacterium]
MTKLDKKKLAFYEKHSVEFTRRQFLYNAGLTSVASYLTLSNLPQLFASKAYAQATNGENLAFVSLECAGGINLGGNVIIGRDNSGTQDEWSSLDSYLLLGFPPELHPSRTGMVDSTFGLKFHATSGILKGMKQVLSGKTVMVNGSPVLVSDMVDGLFLAYRSTDDTSENPLNTSIAAVKAGAKGKLASLIGNIATANGGNSITDPFVYDPVLRPPVIRNSEDAKNLSSLGKFMDENAKDRPMYNNFMRKLSDFSRRRLETIQQSKLPDAAKANIGNAMTRSGPFFTTFTPEILTPMLTDPNDLNLVFPYVAAGDPQSGSYNVNLGLGNLQSDRDTIGTASYLLLENNLVGSASLVIGGGDYHDGSARTGVLKDQELGRYIGEIIYYAALKGKSVVIDLFTDGSAICDATGVVDESPLGQGRVVHYTDSPVQSGSIMLAYRHGKTRAQQPIVKSGSGLGPLRQLGSFLPVKGGGVDLTANSFANNISMVWKIKILNYIALMENTDSVADVLAKFELIYGRGLLADDAKDLIRFNYIG